MTRVASNSPYRPGVATGRDPGSSRATDAQVRRAEPDDAAADDHGAKSAEPFVLAAFANPGVPMPKRGRAGRDAATDAPASAPPPTENGAEQSPDADASPTRAPAVARPAVLAASAPPAPAAQALAAPAAAPAAVSVAATISQAVAGLAGVESPDTADGAPATASTPSPANEDTRTESPAPRRDPPAARRRAAHAYAQGARTTLAHFAASPLVDVYDDVIDVP